MKRRLLLSIFTVTVTFGCGMKTSSVPVTASGCYPSSNQSIGTGNVVPIVMGCGYVNEPCVAVKICVPGASSSDTTQCTTIDHILLDTGSYGLRLFGCTNSLNLPQQTGGVSKTGNTINGNKTISSMSDVTSLIKGQTISGTGIPSGATVVSVTSTTVTMSAAATATGTGVSLTFTGDVAECVHYADGSSDWGPVKLADVYLAGQKAASTPIQIIDAGYNAAPTSCSGAESNPQAAGFNGILGVGLLQYDCPSCNSGSRTGGYYSCTSSGCTGYAAPNAVQTMNPIANLTSNNNGVMLSMPDVSSSGSSSVTGAMVLGIDTVAGVQSTPGVNVTGSNSSSGTTTYAASASVFFNTKFPSNNSDSNNGTSHVFAKSFVDSGSNLWDFASDYLSTSIQNNLTPNYTLCYDGLFCPTVPQTLQATPSGGSAFTFQIINADSANFSNVAFKNLGAYFDPSSDAFDWGMPFYYNRNIFHLIDGKTSNMGTGPAWAW